MLQKHSSWCSAADAAAGAGAAAGQEVQQLKRTSAVEDNVRTARSVVRGRNSRVGAEEGEPAAKAEARQKA